jgi:hypothetical protein
MAHNCPPEDTAAKIAAMTDFLLKTDSSLSVAEAGQKAALRYSELLAELKETSTLLTPAQTESKLMLPMAVPKDSPLHEQAAYFLKGLAHQTTDFQNPNLIIGDHLVRPLEDAFHRYTKALSQGTQDSTFATISEKVIDKGKIDAATRQFVKDVAEDTGWNEAVKNAKASIEDFYGGEKDPERYAYAKEWLNSVTGLGKNSDSYITGLIRAANSNLIKNLLQNRLMSSFRNYFDRMRAGVQYGEKNFLKGWAEWSKAKAAMKKDPNSLASGELEEANILDTRFGEGKQDNLFTASEAGNKGITYFTAKLHALENGYSEARAKIFARNAVEQLQFQTSFVNRPKALWDSTGKLNLSLQTFALGEQRWYLTMWKNLGKAARSGNLGEITKFAMPLIRFAVMQSVLFGPNAAIPSEVQTLWKVVDPKGYASWREGFGSPKNSVFGMLGNSYDELSAPSLTPLGTLTKLPAFYSQAEKIGKSASSTFSNFQQAYEAGDLQKLKGQAFIKALKASALVLPPIPIIGNANAGNATEFLYRYYAGDYTRYNQQGKKYESDMNEELYRLLSGGRPPISRDMEDQKAISGQ